MTALQRTFLNMIRAALWNEPFRFEKGVTPEELYGEACRYEITGITSGKRELFSAGSASVKKQWFVRSVQDLMKARRILDAQSALCELLAQAGIKPVILKGIASAAYYPNPLQRHMGDIDFLVVPEQFDDCCAVMEKNGYEKGKDIQRHVSYTRNGIEFECHRYFSEYGKGIKTDRFLLSACRAAVTKTVEGKSFFTLPNPEYGIMLLEHMKMHMRTGVGFRQYLDWILYADAAADDEAYKNGLQEMLKECGLERYAKVLTRAAQLYLGLRTEKITWCGDVNASVCDELMELLFSCDNFGFTNENKSAAILGGIARRGVLGTLNDEALRRLPLARKVVILRPVAWVWQLDVWAVKYIQRFALHGDRTDGSLKDIRKQKKLLKDIGA